MINIQDLIEIPPFSLNADEKSALLAGKLSELTRFHYNNSPEYRGMLSGLCFDVNAEHTAQELPFLPVRLFKFLSLKSVPDSDIFKTLMSSGTTGQQVSKIFLDRETASLQQKVLVKIVSSFLGASRLPMLIIDCPSVVKNRETFSARGAGILGFSMFGTEKVYVLNDDMRLNIDAVLEFLQKHSGKPILLFGFTFMVWKHFYHELKKLDKQVDLSNGILIHGGGWKKLIGESVSPKDFKLRLEEICGIKRVHDYYGMVEQTGTIYVECECGHLHTSIFSDVITRNPVDWSVCEYNEKGIIEVVSLLPKSYPGHVLLTEDEGVILGEDDCPCGRLGKYFKINGRIAKAELRGCSDTYAAKF